MTYLKLFAFLLLGTILFSSCEKDEVETEAKLIFKFKFDENQERLNNLGNPSSVPPENGSQTPKFNAISAHYLELAPTAFTQLGAGEIVYKGAETSAGGAAAVDFEQASVVDEGETYVSIPLKDVAAGAYEWVRLSLTYQNYEIDLDYNNTPLKGTISSFVGFNTYIGTHQVRNKELVVNDDKLQGFWAFEVHDENLPIELDLLSGESAQTTVPNPISSTSPIPAGSCVVTGEIENGLSITGDETEDIVVILSVSINNSFEWKDENQNNKFEPSEGEQVVDMGLRGLKVFKE